MAIIACKECGHQVSDQAASCPNCGAPPTGTVRAKDKARGRRVLYGSLITLAVLCLIAAGLHWIRTPRQLAGMIGGSNRSSARSAAIEPSAATTQRPRETGAPMRVVYETTAEQLYQDYSANAVATQSKIGNSRIRISGSVAEIVEDASGHPIVKLWTSNDDSADMMLNDDQKATAAQLVKGEKVDVECDKIRPSDMQHRLASPQGSGCELVLVDAGSTQQAYLALNFSADRGIAALYVVGPMSKEACLTRGDGISAQLRASLKRDQVVSKNCAPTARESVPAEGCRLSAEMSAVPDMPAAHLWRYDCAAPAAAAAVPTVPSRTAPTAPVKATAPRKSRPSVAATDHPVVPLPADVIVDDAEPSPTADPAPSQSGRPNAAPAVLAAAPIMTAAAAPIAPAPAVAATAPSAAQNAAAIPADLLTVKATDPGAAEHIVSYCNAATASAGDPAAVAAGCQHEEAAAWNRLVLHNEFPKLDDTTRRKCNEPPFPDSYVAKESCAKYLLGSN